MSELAERIKDLERKERSLARILDTSMTLFGETLARVSTKQDQYSFSVSVKGGASLVCDLLQELAHRREAQERLDEVERREIDPMEIWYESLHPYPDTDDMDVLGRICDRCGLFFNTRSIHRHWHRTCSPALTIIQYPNTRREEKEVVACPHCLPHRPEASGQADGVTTEMMSWYVDLPRKNGAYNCPYCQKRGDDYKPPEWYRPWIEHHYNRRCASGEVTLCADCGHSEGSHGPYGCCLLDVHDVCCGCKSFTLFPDQYSPPEAAPEAENQASDYGVIIDHLPRITDAELNRLGVVVAIEGARRSGPATTVLRNGDVNKSEVVERLCGPVSNRIV